MANGPIQVVLNAANYHVDREKHNGGGPEADAFENNDAAFIKHRDALQAQLQSMSEQLRRDTRANLAYGKVTVRRSMWAKTHRPTKALFRPERTPIVGGDDLGQLLVELTPESLEQVAREVAISEDHVRTKYNEKKKKKERLPTRRRSETGAIESITFWQREDRRRFSVEQAIQWLEDPRSGGAYLVELFEPVVQESEWDALSDSKRALFRSFRDGLVAFGRGIVVDSRERAALGRPLLLIKLTKSDAPPLVRLEFASAHVSTQVANEVDLSLTRHEQLLTFLDQHPLVRRVRLQPRPKHASTSPAALGAGTAVLPVRENGAAYPRVGVIDGGIGSPLSSWITATWDPVAKSHQDTAHGTFIGGLLVAGTSLNTQPAIAELDGCELADVSLLPDDQQPAAFALYYPNGIADFMDEVEASVSQLRRQYDIRVFNFSLNLHGMQADPDLYSPYAERLDQIADATDSIFVISAGNLESPHQRVEWPSDPVAALRSLASARDDKLLVPAESIRNVCVTAVNPEQPPECVAYAPTTYARRGPGLRTGVKPDFCHIGGAGQSHAAAPTGLCSLDPSGAIYHACGTSYAAPLVAKTLARLDHSIEGNVSKETLLALIAHHSAVPAPLKHKALTGLARELVGFGIPSSAESILHGDDHQITLVFAGRLMEGKQLEFRFEWPDVLTKEDGSCWGLARLTLVASPPLKFQFGAELVRVNVDARLQQMQEGEKWKGQLFATYLPSTGDDPLYESELIEHGFKWSPIKTLERLIPKGIGRSSTWRLLVDALTRADEPYPSAGVPFTVVLTIADPKRTKPVFDAMRQTLQRLGVHISDIRTAARVVARV